MGAATVPYGVVYTGESNFSPGTASLSSPGTTYTGESSLSPPSSMDPHTNGAYHHQLYHQQGIIQDQG